MMSHFLAAAESAILVSIVKPILLAVALGFWGTAVGKIDKDLKANFLARRTWNLINVVAGLVGFGVWLFVGSFWIGLPLALVIVGGELVAYVKYRNGKVKEHKRWSFNPREWLAAKRDAALRASAQERALIAFTTKAGVRKEVPAGRGNPLADAHAKVEEILGFALPRGAQRVEMVVGADKAVTRIMVDGMVYPQPDMESKLAMSVVDYLKDTAKLDTQERRKKQVGELYVESGEERKSHLIKLITIGSTREVQVSLIVDPNKSVAMRLADLGLMPAQLSSLEAVVTQPGRAVLVACPPQNGMTSTLYAFLNKHDPYTQSIVTLEDEIAYEVEGVAHSLIEPGADTARISQQLLALTRRDPAVIMVSMVSDVSIAKVIASSCTETRFYAGIRGEDTFSTLKMWIKAVGTPKDAAAALAAIVAPRLVRKLCEKCRQSYQPDPAVLQKMNLPADKVKVMYKPSGKIQGKKEMEICPDCMGMGYKGRTGVFEVMVLDDEARSLIGQGQLDQLRAHLRKSKMLWLQEVALLRVAEGVTAVAEVSRVMSKGEATAARQPKSREGAARPAEAAEKRASARPEAAAPATAAAAASPRRAAAAPAPPPSAPSVPDAIDMDDEPAPAPRTPAPKAPPVPESIELEDEPESLEVDGDDNK